MEQTGKEIEELKNEMNIKFNISEVDFRHKICPIFKTSCKCENCHSFTQGGVRESTSYNYKDKINKIVYHMTKSYCTCAIVTGIVECQTD